METLRRAHFNVLSLEDACSRMTNGSLPARTIVITFDDGYADNVSIALPVLQRHGFPAVVFVAPGFLNGGLMWNDIIIEAVRATKQQRVNLDFIDIEDLVLDSVDDRRRAIAKIIIKIKYFKESERRSLAHRLAQALRVRSLPSDLMLTDAGLRELQAGGIAIGGHTVNHPILAQLDIEQAREEILNCRNTLHETLDAEIRLFAYPNGKPGRDYHAEHVRILSEAGFEFAVSTAWGAARPTDDPLQLPRVGFSESRFVPLWARLIRSYWSGAATRV